MKKIMLLISVLAVGVTAFVSGYLYRFYEFTPDAEIEDYALTNVLLTVSSRHFLEDFEPKDFKKEIDTNLTMHLNRVRNSSAFKENDELAEVRLKVLSLAYCYWSSSPPFYPKDFGESHSWAEEWRENHAANIELISQAHEERLSRGGGKCP